MTATLVEQQPTTAIADLSPRPTLRDTVDQTLAMAWRATKKMRRNPEQWFDVTIQPLLFTAMFAYIFGGAISGSVADYLPVIIPGILAQTALTACMATGIQLREDMDKGVFDRFKSLPIARIAPLAGPDAGRPAALRDRVHAHHPGRRADGLPPRRRRPRRARRRGCSRSSPAGRWPGSSPGWAPSPAAPRRAGHLDDDHVPADLPVQRVRPRGHPARLAPDLRASSTPSRTWCPRCAT